MGYRMNIPPAASGGSTGIANGISWDAFDVDGNLTEATVYGTTIVSSSLSGKEQLAVLNLPDTLLTIGNSALDGTLISSIILPSSVTTIGQGAFYYCVNLIINNNNALPENLETIGAYAFGGCFSMSKIWIPNSVLLIPTEFADASPFLDAPSGLAIYCEAASKPAGWGEYWNYYDQENALTVVWGVSKAAFDALE